MGNLIFFAKNLAMTALIVILLQVKVGTNTLEEKALMWVRESSIAEPLQEVAEGATLMVRDLWLKLTRNLNTDFSRSVTAENRPGQRTLKMQWNRSKEFVEEQAERAAKKVNESLSAPSDEGTESN